MSSFAVVFPRSFNVFIQNALAQEFAVTVLDGLSDPDVFVASEGAHVDALVTNALTGTIDAAFLRRFPNLKLIAHFGVGYDSIDTAYAAANGITVTHTPDVLTDEVADLAMGLLLATVREIPQADRYLRRGAWKDGAYPLSASLKYRTMGIVGLGRIGKAIAHRAEAFGVTVAYHGRNPQPNVDYRYYGDVISLAKACDILMVAAPATAETRHLVNADVLNALGPSGIVINIARGSLVDEDALIAALQDKRIHAAGLDVFAHEPHVPEALMALENTVLLPHVGSGSFETRQAMAQLVVDNVRAFARGQAPLTPVPETPWVEAQ